MIAFLKRTGFAVTLVVALAAGPVLAQTSPRDFAAEEANRELVIEFYERFFNERIVEAAEALANDYIQHNPQLPDGKDAVLSLVSAFLDENPEWHGHIVRSATDGDLVFLHVHQTNGPEDRGQAIVEIFRVDEGKIVEHWDVIQPVPESAANDNTMF